MHRLSWKVSVRWHCLSAKLETGNRAVCVGEAKRAIMRDCTGAAFGRTRGDSNKYQSALSTGDNICHPHAAEVVWKAYQVVSSMIFKKEHMHMKC